MKLTKEDIDKVRDIDGFPKVDDLTLIKLSNPIAYTAFPNPFIHKFIHDFGKKYDVNNDSYDVSAYSDDVEENKHDLIYNVHGYHTKVPPKAIKTYIKHYTKPGDIVLDCFSGSGMTGVAAQLCGESENEFRHAIISDISTYATFVASNYNKPFSITDMGELEKIISLLKDKFAYLYQTKHEIDGRIVLDIENKPILGKINYVVWSDVLYCNNCNHEMVYYDVALNPENKKTLKEFNCTNCNAEITKRNIVLKKENIIKSNGEHGLRAVKVPVLINYSVNKTRYNKFPDQEDIKKMDEVTITKWYPNDELPYGFNTEQPKKSHGYDSVDCFYTKRTLLFLSEFYNLFKNDNRKKFLFTSILPKLTLMNRFMPNHGSRALVGPMVGTYYVPSLSVENNVLNQFDFRMKKLKNLRYKEGNVAISTQSATDLSNVPDNSIDYIFIDPPFGANIMYSELNFIPESWLGIKTNNVKEAIVNKTQEKDISDYKNLMEESFVELFRVLKPKRWITIEFHNSKNSIWNSIQEAISLAGFVIADVRVLSKEKKTVMQYKSSNTVDQDLVISAYKPSNYFIKNFVSHSGSVETVWDFVRQHLEKLQPFVLKNNVIEVMPERQAFLLFDRMVAYHIINGLSVPMDAVEFYKGLDERFIKRDGMYFLSDQVNEYDNARIYNDVEDIQLSLIVNDEKTAIAWLYQQLEEPQTYAEIQPNFMKEVKSIVKYEKMPELGILLEDNFLQTDEEKWYIPDVNKSADLTKLREKKLLKEFEDYISIKGKLKLFRIEAVRVGFAKLWKDNNYKLIVDIAERLPETVIQEDDKLLMYYDISLGRI